jgi:hypothetical protein
MVALFLGLLEYAEYSDNLPSGRTTGGDRTAATGPVGAARLKKNKPSIRPNNVKRQHPEAPAPQMHGRAERGEPPVEVKFGPAGTFIAYVDVRWLDLPKETLIALRDHIEAIKALGYEDSAPPSTDAADDEVAEEAVS